MKRALGVTVGVLLIARLASAADDFESALKAARANEASAAGRAYVERLFQKFGPALHRSMQQCFPKTANAAGTAFTIVFNVRANGTLASLMVRPESPATACVLKGIEAVQVAAPPHPDWWALVEMAVTP